MTNSLSVVEAVVLGKLAKNPGPTILEISSGIIARLAANFYTWLVKVYRLMVSEGLPRGLHDHRGKPERIVSLIFPRTVTPQATFSPEGYQTRRTSRSGLSRLIASL